MELDDFVDQHKTWMWRQKINHTWLGWCTLAWRLASTHKDYTISDILLFIGFEGQDGVVGWKSQSRRLDLESHTHTHFIQASMSFAIEAGSDLIEQR